MMLDHLPPGLILILGAAVVPFLPGRLRNVVMLALPLVALGQLVALEHGDYFAFSAFGGTLIPVHVDKISLLFGYVFCIAAFVSVLFALHVEKALEHVAGLVYAGAAIGAVFAGDLITLFVYWELTAVSSVFLILASRRPAAIRAAMRYILIQVGSGVILLAGLVLHFGETGSFAFTHFGVTNLATTLIFIAFGIKCAFPLLHNWLQDAYPEATVSGTVWLSAFTTKLAVYCLARGFAGEDMLIWIGATMTAFPLFYAVIESDLRRVLAYSLNTQLGFMVVGVGIGTELALNGTAAHAFSSVLYKGLLFMSMGAVLYRVGTIKSPELGGLHKSMPWTTGFCVVGAASISAFPLFSGFISKSMILSAAAENHHFLVWLMLLFASASVFLHSGMKIPYFTFFAQDSGKRCKEAPPNMLAAMAIASVLCIGIGCFPGYLYDLLPYPVDYVPYTTTHVITQLQLLLFSALAFAVLIRTGIYPSELKSTNLDSDWIYRRALPAVLNGGFRLGGQIWQNCLNSLHSFVQNGIRSTEHLAGLEGLFGRHWRTGAMAIWAVGLLGFSLVFYFA